MPWASPARRVGDSIHPRSPARGRLTDRDLARFPGETLLAASAALPAMPGVFHARSCMKPGRRRAVCAGCFEAAASSISPRVTGCSHN